MEEDLKVITTRLSQWVIDYVEKVAKEQNLDKATVYRQLLIKAIAQDRVERAIESFQGQQVTITKAAELADLPLTLFVDELFKRHIRWGVGIEEYARGTANLKKGIKRGLAG